MSPPDFILMDGCQGGEVFNFVPAHYSVARGTYDFHDPYVFNVSENSFVYIEGIIAQAFPKWRDDYRYGKAYLEREIWLHVLSGLSMFSADLHGAVLLEKIVEKYAIQPSFWNEEHKFQREGLVEFLDQFAARISKMIDHYPYVVIEGI